MVRETVSPLADEVQQVRTELGISQNEVARRAGVHASILSRLLRGGVVAEPSEKKLRAWLSRQRRRLPGQAAAVAG